MTTLQLMAMKTVLKTPQKLELMRLEELKEELFQIIESTMEKEDISQGEVARRMGAQRYNINKVMRRKFPVTLDFLVKMAESAGLQIDLKVSFKKGELHKALSEEKMGSARKQKIRSKVRNSGVK
jgi:predicted XRE-type DNA-binding protein